MSRATQNSSSEARRKTLRRVVGVLAGMATILATAAVSLVTYSYVVTTPRLAITRIEIEGATSQHADEIRTLTGVRTGQNILVTDLDLVRASVEEHPWVGEALVSRALPDTLRVVVSERVPALVLALDRLYLVDRTGFPFKVVSAGDNVDLPVLTGLSQKFFEAEPEKGKAVVLGAIAALDAAVTENALAATDISEIAHSAEGYSLTTVNGRMTVHVGDDHFAERFWRLSRVKEKDGLGQAQAVDLRFAARVIVAR